MGGNTEEGFLFMLRRLDIETDEDDLYAVILDTRYPVPAGVMPLPESQPVSREIQLSAADISNFIKRRIEFSDTATEHRAGSYVHEDLSSGRHLLYEMDQSIPLFQIRSLTLKEQDFPTFILHSFGQLDFQQIPNLNAAFKSFRFNNWEESLTQTRSHEIEKDLDTASLTLRTFDDVQFLADDNWTTGGNDTFIDYRLEEGFDIYSTIGTIFFPIPDDRELTYQFRSGILKGMAISNFGIIPDTYQYQHDGDISTLYFQSINQANEYSFTELSVRFTAEAIVLVSFSVNFSIYNANQVYFDQIRESISFIE